MASTVDYKSVFSFNSFCASSQKFAFSRTRQASSKNRDEVFSRLPDLPHVLSLWKELLRWGGGTLNLPPPIHHRSFRFSAWMKALQFCVGHVYRNPRVGRLFFLINVQDLAKEATPSPVSFFHCTCVSQAAVRQKLEHEGI